MKEEATTPSESEEVPSSGGVISDSLESVVLQEYEKRPYPAEDERVLSDRSWKLAPFGWWNGVGRLVDSVDQRPARILVAGCGTGNEAFTLARFSPDSQVVGVDFSEKSIAVANRWRTAADMKNVRFIQADLTAPDLASQIGEAEPFDLISCHGVISYIPKTVDALKNLEGLLAKGGALYLGCNGSTHLSRRYRPMLTEMGCDLGDFSPGAEVRAKLLLCDDILGVKAGSGIASQSDGFVASDIFSSMNLCLSLGEWIDMAEKAGLTFLGSIKSMTLLSQIKYVPSVNLLREMPLAKIHTLVDQCRPCAFHRILFGKQGRLVPSFSAEKTDSIAKWRPLVNLWNRKAIPEIKKPYDKKISFKLNIPGLYKDHAIEAKSYVLEFFRLSDGETSMEEIASSIGSGLTVEQLSTIAFRFYLCGMLSMRPPKFD